MGLVMGPDGKLQLVPDTQPLPPLPNIPGGVGGLGIGVAQNAPPSFGPAAVSGGAYGQPKAVAFPPALIPHVLDYFARLSQPVPGMGGLGSAGNQPGFGAPPLPDFSWAAPMPGVQASGQNDPQSAGGSLLDRLINPPQVGAPQRQVGSPPNDTPPSHQDLEFSPTGWGQWLRAGLHPFDARDAAGQMVTDAQKAAHDAYPQMEGRNDDGDAFRHAFWSYNVAKKYGQTEAKAFGDLHEIYDPNPEDERLMDLYNNKVGRDLAAQDGNVSADEAIKDAMRRRLLRTRPYD